MNEETITHSGYLSFHFKLITAHKEAQEALRLCKIEEV